MVSDQFKVGDEVVMDMDAESRGWISKKYVPNGTVGKIIDRPIVEVFHARIGYNADNPGRFTQLGGTAIVNWNIDCTDQPYQALEECSLFHLKMVDKEEAKRRSTEYGELLKKHDSATDALNIVRQLKKVGELPETKFWELDVVALVDDSRQREGYTYRVTSIDYRREAPDNGTWYDLRAYDEDGEPSFSIMAVELDLQLVARGNVYKYFNGQEVVFADLREEVAFAEILNQVKQVRNPRTGYYTWTKEEILEDMRAGKVHAMKMGGGFFGNAPRPYAVIFTDLELGERMRKETLKGFEDS